MMPTLRCQDVIERANPYRLLNTAGIAAARKAAERIPGYDIAGVMDHLRHDDIATWKESEIIANLDRRTAVGCPEPQTDQQVKTLRERFSEAVDEMSNTYLAHRRTSAT